MGQQQTKAKATEALRLALEQAMPPLTDEQKKAIIRNFEKELRLLL